MSGRPTAPPVHITVHLMNYLLCNFKATTDFMNLMAKLKAITLMVCIVNLGNPFKKCKIRGHRLTLIFFFFSAYILAYRHNQAPRQHGHYGLCMFYKTVPKLWNNYIVLVFVDIDLVVAARKSAVVCTSNINMKENP